MQIQKIETILQQKKIPITSMRTLVLDVFLTHEKSISLVDLEQILNHSDRSTLYRTLKTFEKKGLIHGVQENNTTHYLLCNDSCDENHHHDLHLHFFCTICEQTECLEEVNFNQIQFPKNYDFKEFKFVANGICKNCIKQKN